MIKLRLSLSPRELCLCLLSSEGNEKLCDMLCFPISKFSAVLPHASSSLISIATA